MLFNSLEFLIFLPLVFAGYWLLARSLKLQNLFAVVASYVFYGWWDWRFLLLISFTSVWAWTSGLAIERFGKGADASAPRTKENWVVAGALIVNLGILGVFKYYNFFLDNAVALLNAIGFQPHPSSLKIILPVGISFYTFQALSYVIDVYRKDIKPTRDLVAFLAFVSFFPQLVAGPIERATNLLPQFLKSRQFDHALAVEGCRQILWGFLKKCVIADRFAALANAIFLNGDTAGAGTLIIGSVAFTIQIYGDFSGYSDIAIGCGKLFGVRLMRNFATPYFARSIAEFWRRWHISLTTWFRDYLYIPLGGSRCGTAKRIRNTFAIFLVSGFWHGANWTFVLWGAFHALCFLPLLLLGTNRKNLTDEGRLLPRFWDVPRMLVTMALVVFGWMLFRAPDISTFATWVGRIAGAEGWRDMWFALPRCTGLQMNLLLAGGFFAWEWCTRKHDCPLFALPKIKALRWVIYIVLLLVVFINMPDVAEEFIYFQF